MYTIYKKDSKGNIRYIKIYTKKEVLIQESGVYGTNRPIKHERICKAKNIGKVNETSPEQQAILEMNSIVKDKLDHGYFASLKELEKSSSEVILPMLAKDYEDEYSKINWDNKDIFVQRKLDGQRCLAIIKDGSIQLVSRQGKVIKTVPHIVESLLKLIKNNTSLILDGELYNMELGGFQDQMKAIKKYRPEITTKIQYHIYDSVDTTLPFPRRIEKVKDLLYNDNNHNHLKLVETIQIYDSKKIEEYHKLFVSEGYEGIIIRHGSSPYEINKRSTSLLKYKKFKDFACTIIDVIPSDARPNQGVLVCRMPDSSDKIFKANLKFSHEEREQILKKKNKYIGLTAEIRCFELTDDGLPRFPVCHGFRLDK